jgi:hypothetical protein
MAVAGNSLIRLEVGDFVLLILIDMGWLMPLTMFSVYPLLESYALMLKKSLLKDINDLMLLLLNDLPLEHI